MPNQSQKSKDLAEVLTKFYKQPVAKVSTELILSLLTILFFALFAIKPTLVTISELIDEIEVKEELNQELQKKIAALSTAQEVYQSLLPRIDVLNQAVPTQPQLIESLKIIERLAGEEDVIIESIGVAEIPEEKVPEDLGPDKIERVDNYLNMRVLGDYPSIRDFVSQLQNNRRAFVVEEVNFLIEEQITQQTLKANLLVRTPYFGVKDAESISNTTRKN